MVVRFAYVVTITGEFCSHGDFCYFSMPQSLNFVIPSVGVSAIVGNDAVSRNTWVEEELLVFSSAKSHAGSAESNMLGLRVTTLRHKRSKSFPGKKRVEEDGLGNSPEASNRIKLDMEHLKDSVKTQKKQSPTPSIEVQNSLKQEILQLEKKLQYQFEVRRALETAFGYRTSSHEDRNETSVSVTKPATELIKEIAVLELEVVYLEQYILSLYRKAFDQQVSSIAPSKRCEMIKTPIDSPRTRFSKVSKPDDASKVENSALRSGYHDNSCKAPCGFEEEKLLDSGVHRCHSSLCQHSVYSSRAAPPEENLDKAIRTCHSQPLSMMEYAQNSSNAISLAEHLGTRTSDHVPETPNKLSEDMIKCMAAIYCKLAEPAIQNGLSSPNSSTSSASAFSPLEQHDMWSPGFGNNSSFDVRLDNPFHVEGKEFSGPYSTMVEVPWIFRDSQKLGDVEHLLQNFREAGFLDKHNNSLVMHAFLAYGIPQNNVKRLFLLLRAAYNIGGHTISADTIQNTILGCRISRPGLVEFYSRFCFPACSGLDYYFLRGRSLKLEMKGRHMQLNIRNLFYTLPLARETIPILQYYFFFHQCYFPYYCIANERISANLLKDIRAYTPKRAFQELETAKEEYIRATFGVRKDQKILLPKIVESFAKDSRLCPAGVTKMIQHSLPESLRRSFKKCQLGKPRKSIAWIPHNFTFRLGSNHHTICLVLTTTCQPGLLDDIRPLGTGSVLSVELHQF
ncbi:putative set domain protein [Hibiscus syriacus]|uniref:Set domain protein n=1 Tax=Hibiscus syriacus TaxID=106335 RepID=A0A6A2ZP22_HIBSY|nr:putative set domain protein [Hibiscus syriacus]